MKVKILAILISMGISLTTIPGAMAVNDATGDNNVAGKDLASASVQTFDREDMNAVPSRINLGIKMVSGSHLPGLVVWEFDVDNNSTTGSSSVLNTPLPTAEGGGVGPYKETSGFDFKVVMALRAQAETSDTALCHNCNDNAEDCAMGLVKGEWYAVRGSGTKPFIRGSIYLPSAWVITEESQLCAKLPWAYIVTRAIEDGADFNVNYAINNPPGFQVSIWHDRTFTDGDDFMDSGQLINLSDFLPNGSLDKANGEYNQYPFCKHNVNGDENVDAVEVNDFLTEFGRSYYDRVCPTCKYATPSDTTGDNYVPQIDLAGASVQTFDKEATGAVPSRINLGIKMKTSSPASHLPGLVVWEFDVDNNNTTGTSTILNTPLSTAEGGGAGPYKETTGFDFRVVMALRAQAETSDTALCHNCNDNAEDCAMGLVKGEWYAVRGSGTKPFIRGSIYLSELFNINYETQLCPVLPWAYTLTRAVEDGADFDVNYTINNPPKFQVSIWYDSTFTDGDDFMDSGQLINLSDFLPNGSLDKANGEYNQYPFCKHNINGDLGVDSVEVTDFLTEFGRTIYRQPCPACKY